MTDPTQRFSSRVENYSRYRPSYPRQVLELLFEECGLTAASIIADIGSGTGIMTRLFLENGNQVFAVEPNREMRQEAEWNLASYSHFVSVDATAEATTLRAGSVDFVVAAQAFHWFDREKVRPEFVRILKPEGWVVLVWNDRRPDSTPSWPTTKSCCGSTPSTMRPSTIARWMPKLSGPSTRLTNAPQRPFPISRPWILRE